MKRYNALAQSMDELALQSDAERRGAEERSAQVKIEFEESLQRIEVAMSQLEALFNSGASGFSQGGFVCLREADRRSHGVGSSYAGRYGGSHRAQGKPPLFVSLMKE